MDTNQPAGLGTINQTPAYNMKFFLIETGLKADVLRAWERRYNLPRPQRTAGGHRLYSDYDLAIVRWLMARQAEGLSISHAVTLWNDLVVAGKNPLAEAAFTPPGPARPAFPASAMSMEALQKTWLDGCLAFDATRADEALNQAFALFPVEIACTAILQQGLRSLGELWHLGKASVQQEHFASALAIRRVESLLAAEPQATRTQSVLLACVPGELHTFPLLLLALFVKRAGYPIIYLGADLPADQLNETLGVIRPKLTVLTAQHLATAASLASLTRVLASEGHLLAYGGGIFNRAPALRQQISATFLGEGLEEAAIKIGELVNTPPEGTVVVQANDENRSLAKLFRQKRALIEHALVEKLAQQKLQFDKVEEVNSLFASALASALDLGDLALLEDELGWVEELLASRHNQANRLIPYLAMYGQCVSAQLGQPGQKITHWIEEMTTRRKQH